MGLEVFGFGENGEKTKMNRVRVRLVALKRTLGLERTFGHKGVCSLQP